MYKSAALEVMHVTSNSIWLHFSVNDNVNVTFHIEVDGQYWAHTVRSFYIVSGLASDREYAISVDVIRNGRPMRTLRQSAQTRQLSEYLF